MTTNSTNVIPNQLNFGSLKGRKVIADFSGGRITSDAGIVLLAELDKKLKVTARFAECFRDYRDLSYVDYSVHKLLAQRVYGIVLGYEDVTTRAFTACPAPCSGLNRTEALASYAALKDTAPHAPKVALKHTAPHIL